MKKSKSVGLALFAANQRFWHKRSFGSSLFEITNKNPALHRAKQGLNRSKSGQTALKYKQQDGKHNEHKADGDSAVQYDLREMG